MSAAHILVVGRNPEIMGRVRSLLDSGGYAHLGALTDEDAIQAIVTGSPDALLIGGGVEPASRAALIDAFQRHRPGRPVIEHAGGPWGLLEHIRAVLGGDR